MKILTAVGVFKIFKSRGEKQPTVSYFRFLTQ
jgi:hypothetical protein